MQHPAAETDPAPTLEELFEATFRAWWQAGTAGPRSPEVRRLWERTLLDPSLGFLGRPGKHFRARLVTTSWILAGGRLEARPPVGHGCLILRFVGRAINPPRAAGG